MQGRFSTPDGDVVITLSADDIADAKAQAQIPGKINEVMRRCDDVLERIRAAVHAVGLVSPGADPQRDLRLLETHLELLGRGRL